MVVVAVLGKSGVYQFRFGRRGGGKAVKLSFAVVSVSYTHLDVYKRQAYGR